VVHEANRWAPYRSTPRQSPEPPSIPMAHPLQVCGSFLILKVSGHRPVSVASVPDNRDRFHQEPAWPT
jgi:hypothetical protein